MKQRWDAVSAAGGHHAKAVGLLGVYLTRYHGGAASALRSCRNRQPSEGAGPDEQRVARALVAWQRALPAEAQDVIALATAFRDPQAEARLREYLVSPPVRTLLHETWGRTYEPFAAAGRMDGKADRRFDSSACRSARPARPGVGG